MDTGIWIRGLLVAYYVSIACGRFSPESSVPKGTYMKLFELDKNKIFILQKAGGWGLRNWHYNMIRVRGIRVYGTGRGIRAEGTGRGV